MLSPVKEILRMGNLETAMSSVLSYENLFHAVSGAVGSMTAMSLFYPLDTARLRLQVDEKRKTRTTPAVLMEIIQEEGLLAPYRGWFPVISSLCCSSFVYFYTFNSLKALWVKGSVSPTGKDLTIGFIAGVVNVLLTTPLWVVNTRLKLQGAKFRNDDIMPTAYTGITAPSKIPANRLKMLLPSLIHPDQTGFILFREVTDRIQRNFHVLHLACATQTPMMFLSLDGKKAFDRVDWHYLNEIIAQFGLAPYLSAVSTLYHNPITRIKCDVVF